MSFGNVNFLVKMVISNEDMRMDTTQPCSFLPKWEEWHVLLNAQQCTECDISNFHNSDYEQYYLLGCDTVCGLVKAHISEEHTASIFSTEE
jgi:hypothetical protein